MTYDALPKIKRRPGASTSAENARAIVRAFGERRQGTAIEDFGTTDDAPVAQFRQPSARVPICDLRASAGQGEVPDDDVSSSDEIELEERYRREVLTVTREHAVTITVKGDSMEPTFRNNDVRVVDVAYNRLPVVGLHVINLDGSLLIKRLSRTPGMGHLLVGSDNNDRYPAHGYAVERIRAAGAEVRP